MARGDGDGAETVILSHDERHVRRRRMTTDAGRGFILDLPKAAELRDGEALVLDDGGAVTVRAAAEPLMEARATRFIWRGSPGM